MLSLPAVPTDSDDDGLELMMSIGLVPVSAEMRRTRTSPPIPPPTGRAIPIPRRSSTFPLPARPCHLIVVSASEAQGRRPKAEVKNEAKFGGRRVRLHHGANAARMPTRMAQL